MQRFAALSFSALCLSLGCTTASTPGSSGAAPLADPAPAVAKPAPLVVGAAIATPPAKDVSLVEVAKRPKDFEGKTIATSGTVVAVCQNMGCWLAIKDESGEAHVKLAGHKFFVPKDSKGKKARVEGRLIPVNAEEECAKEAAEQTGKMAKLQLEATGVELQN